MPRTYFTSQNYTVCILIVKFNFFIYFLSFFYSLVVLLSLYTRTVPSYFRLTFAKETSKSNGGRSLRLPIAD